MKNCKVLIVGDSHIYAIRDGLKRFTDRPNAIEIEVLRLSSLKDGSLVGDISTEDAIKMAGELSADDVVVTMIRGNQFNSIGLIQHPRPFDFLMFTVEGGVVRPGAELIPVQMMRSYFAATLRAGNGKTLLKFKRASGAPLICVAPPAPKEDAEHILKGAETYFRNRGISDVGVTPAATRLKLWLLQQEALRAFCAEHGMTFMSNPAGTRDEKGFLKREFYEDDATHANADYGVLVLNEIARQIVDRQRPEIATE